MGLTPSSPSAAPRRAGTQGLAARRLATRLLRAVLKDRRPLDESFGALIATAPFAALEFRDRAFARAIATAALRHLGQIEDLLHRFIELPLPPDAFAARAILVAGAAQLVFLDVAPHAAIGLAVEHGKRTPGAARYCGLINAVLRRVAEHGPALLPRQNAPRLNTPSWLMRRWETHYGADAAARIATAHQETPPLDLSVRSEAAEWAKRLGAELLPWNSLRLRHKGRVEAIEGYEDGAWWVQDAAAALPALLLGPVEGLRVADLCAAPGGKTAQLAARGARVTAVDISSNRLRRVEQNLARLRFEAEIITADAVSFEPPVLFDAVLLDAPCSATGIIRRNPDIPYLKTNTDIATMAEVQQRLLRQALRLVKPGGRVVYCTCSLEPEESEVQIANLLKSSDRVVIDPIGAAEPSLPLELLTQDGMLRTLPFHQPGASSGGMDGFFAARLIRTS